MNVKNRHAFTSLLFQQCLNNDVIKASLFADDVCELKKS